MSAGASSQPSFVLERSLTETRHSGCLFSRVTCLNVSSARALFWACGGDFFSESKFVVIKTVEEDHQKKQATCWA